MFCVFLFDVYVLRVCHFLFASCLVCLRIVGVVCFLFVWFAFCLCFDCVSLLCLFVLFDCLSFVLFVLRLHCCCCVLCSCFVCFNVGCCVCDLFVLSVLFHVVV